MKKLTCLLAIVALLLSLTTSAWSEEKAFIVPIDADGVQRLVVVGGSYYYEPNHIIVKRGIPVEMSITKEPGIAPHDIVMKVPEAGIVFSEAMTKGNKVIQFTPNKIGKFQFYCSERFLFFKSHRAHGMEGILEVRD